MTNYRYEGEHWKSGDKYCIFVGKAVYSKKGVFRILRYERVKKCFDTLEECEEYNNKLRW